MSRSRGGLRCLIRSMTAQPQALPFIPDHAPFTPAQRAWLNGFLAGIFSGATPAPAQFAAPAVKLRLPIFFGSESGNCEALAKKIAKGAQQKGWQAPAIALDKITAAELSKESCVLIITSTFGDGDPPENARKFCQELSDPSQPRLENLSYSVLALGDRNYEHFCKCGIDVDTRLSALGARRIYERVDCDVDYEPSFDRWQTGVFGVLGAMSRTDAPAVSTGDSLAAGEIDLAAPPPHSRKHPFPARLLTNRKLTTEGSAKETRHLEISLEGSALSYEVGDAVGVMPANCPGLVDELLHVLNCDGEEAVFTPEELEVALRTALLRHYEITSVPALLLKTIAGRSADRTLADLMVPEAKDALQHYLSGREIVDVLADFRSVTFAPADFVAHLRPLRPRLYSIASSLKAHPGQVHLTVAVLRYENLGRKRKGVCSTFLAERTNATVPVFVQASHSFRLPAGGDVPIIMVGPGTGVAPFRAFLHERRASGARGRNWLFFGEQHAATDFFYREELEAMMSDGHLTQLSTAFSRDQAEKIYVQHLMIKQGGQLWAWLEEGAHFYVCGDAVRMARDVDAALREVIERHGGLGREAATAYIENLKAARRYQRDVY